MKNQDNIEKFFNAVKTNDIERDNEGKTVLMQAESSRRFFFTISRILKSYKS